MAKPPPIKQPLLLQWAVYEPTRTGKKLIELFTYPDRGKAVELVRKYRLEGRSCWMQKEKDYKPNA